MKIWVLERDTDEVRPGPKVFLNKEEAEKTLNDEYNCVVKSLKEEEGWEFNNFLKDGGNDASILDLTSSERYYYWRLTEHTI